MAKADPNVLTELSKWQQKLFANNPMAQIQQNNPKAWAAYQTASATPGAAPGVPAQGDPNAGSGGTGMPGQGGPMPGTQMSAGGPGGLFKQMGGQKGTKMTRKEFNKWYQSQTKVLGQDLATYLGMSGITTGTWQQQMAAMRSGGGGATGSTLPFAAGSGVLDYASPKYLNDAGELYWLNRASPVKYGSLEEAKNAMALAAGFAGVSQWNTNIGNQGGANFGQLPAHLQNTSKQDIRYDPNAYNLFFNALAGMSPKDAQARLAAQQALVPEWAAGVDEALRKQEDINRPGQTGIPFGFELLGDPSINLTGKGPLFGSNMPASLFQMHMGQAGEADVLRTASAEELMGDLWPIYHAQYHRPAGAPAPFEAGLSFGSPVQMPNGMYNRSPMMGYGSPSDNYMVDPDLIRMEGYAGQSVPESELYASLAGGIYPRYQAYNQYQGLNDWNQTRQGLGLPAETDAMYWSYPEYQPFQNLQTTDPDAWARIMSVIGHPAGPGGTIG